MFPWLIKNSQLKELLITSIEEVNSVNCFNNSFLQNFEVESNKSQ